MAIRALRAGAVENIRLGLLALSIEEGKYDFRDSLCSFAMLKHAAVRTGINFPSIAESISRISSETFSQLLQSFLSRSAENSSLAAMGQTETRDQNGMTMKFDVD